MNISDSLMVADNNISANKSKVSNTEMNAGRNIYAGNSSVNNSNLVASNDIIISGSKVANSTVTADKDLKLQDSTLNKTKITGRKGFLKGATLENSSDVTVDYVTNNSYAENETVENLVIRNSKLKSNKNNINLKDTTIEKGTLITADGKDVNIDTGSDVELVGSKIGGDLNVTRARNLVIANSQESGNQYIPNLTDKTSVTDYDRTKFDDNYFENIINNYGRDYGNNTNLSIIKGNVNISNTKNSLIINSIIGKDLTTNNVYGVSNLITSLVEGNYNPARVATADSSVYKAFIGGNYEKRFEDRPVILPELSEDRPVVAPEQQQNSNTTVQNSDERNRLTYTDEVNKRKFGNDINTSFRRRFSPRGFAAQEDEINEMKNSTKSSIVRTENKNVKFTKSFHAY